MANKKLKTELEANNSALNDASLTTSNTVATANSNDTKAKKSAGKGNKFFSKIGKLFKEMFSELKKVNWPTAKVVLASFATVVVVVLFFLLVTMGFDSLCAWLLSLLTQTNA